MTRTVEDACILLDALSGRSEIYTRSLGSKLLDGIRLLLPTNLPDLYKLLQHGQEQQLVVACNVLRSLGAEVVEAPLADECLEVNDFHGEVAETEFARDLNKYLASLDQ